MRRLLRHQFRRTTLWLVGCLAFLLGVGFAHSGWLLLSWWYLLALLALMWRFQKHSIWTICWVIVLAGSFGWQRGSFSMIKLQAYQARYGHVVSLEAVAIDDAVYGKKSQISFEASQVLLSDGERLTGKIQLSGFGVNAVFQGDRVRASGKLFPGYGAYQGRISFAKLHVTSHHPTLVADIRRRFAAGMQSSLPEPLASFAMGLLIGQRATLPPAVKQELLMVGLTHIIAVSGYNLTIMLGASRRLAGKRSKRLSTLIALGLMGIFLLLAGASASIVRAAIVSMLSIGAGYYGRSYKPLNLILMAAAITAWANPFYVWSDISWYLSFLAFFGVLLLAPLLVERLRPGWHNSVVVMVGIESICAEIMTLPFILHNFGQMSLIGLPANILVVTLIPLAMLCSLVAGLAGMLTVSVAGWLAWPARILLTYMLDVAHILAHVPHIFLQKLGLSLSQMLGLYAITASLTTALWLQTKRQKHAKVTEISQAYSEGATA